MRGKLHAGWGDSLFDKDHPRVCGENIPIIIEALPQIRITPAYAGKTFNELIGKVQNADHPRVCGENLDELCKKRCRRGSPPRMRGKLSDLRSSCYSPGITPAYAGKTA